MMVSSPRKYLFYLCFRTCPNSILRKYPEVGELPQNLCETEHEIQRMHAALGVSVDRGSWLVAGI